MQSYQLEYLCTFFKFPVLWIDALSEEDFICEKVKMQIKICKCCSAKFNIYIFAGLIAWLVSREKLIQNPSHQFYGVFKALKLKLKLVNSLLDRTSAFMAVGRGGNILAPHDLIRFRF